MTRQVDENWKLLQQTTFTKWVNNALRGHLKKAKTQVNDLQTDLKDGLVLVELIENIASPRRIGRYSKKPTIKPQMLENLGAVFRFLEKERIKVVNIGPEDIYSGNLKLILGLIWTLIRHFQIRSTGKDISTKNALLAWVNTQIPDQKVTNFTTDWNDGIALCALVNRIQPGLCPHYATLSPTEGVENCQLGMDIADEKLNIPKLLEAADLNNRDVDELSVMTYVSYFCKPANERLMHWIQSKIPQQNVTNFKTDWNNGINLACLLDTLVPGSFPDCHDLDPHESLQNLVRAMKLAEDHLGVKPVVKPSQLADPNVDELNVVTYLSRFQYAKALPQPQEINCSGHGLRKAFVGRPTFFQVDTSRAGTGDLSVTITSVGGAPVSADVNEIGKGCYEVKYIPNRPGTIIINVSWDDQPVPGSPFMVDILDPNEFVVKGPQVNGVQCARIGKPVMMDIKGVTDIADLYVMVQHSDAHTSAATVKAKGKDEAECTYTPTRIGTDDVFVKVVGEDIPGSPFSVNVVDPSQCSVSHREPAVGKLAVAHHKVTFTVTASEANIRGIVVELKTPTGEQELSLEPRTDGFSIGSFVPVSTGNYTVLVTCAGENVRGSPLSIVISDPAKCAILDTIPRYLQLNKPVELNISTKGAGPGVLETSSNQSGVLEVSLNKRDSEFYSLRLLPHAIGEATIGIKWNAENLSSTPFGVFVCDASKCSAYGPGLTEGKGKVGEPFRFTVQATQAGRGDLVVKPSGQKAVYAAETKQNQRGTYSVQFTTYETGPHSIDILWGGAPIPNSPFKVQFIKCAEATQFSASGDGLRNAIALQRAKFTVISPESGLLKDDTLSVKLSGGTSESETVAAEQFHPACGKPVVSVTDNHNGTYQVEYAVPEAGKYMINILCDGDHIPNSPYTLKALPAPDASQCRAFGEAIDNPSKIVVGKPLEFQVDSTQSGTGQLKVIATDPSSKNMPIYLAEDKTPQGQRVHIVKVHPTVQGSHKVTVNWCDRDIPGSPLYFEVSDPKNVIIVNLPDAQKFIAEVDEAFEFEVDPRKAGKGEVKAACKMEDGKTKLLDISEQPNGTFRVKCVPTHTGNMELLLTFSGVNILPAPWVCNVANLSLFQVHHPKGYGKLKEYVKFVITGLTKKNVANMVITATHPEHNATVKVEYGKDRTAVARFTAKQKGEYRCEVHCGKKHIQGSPFYVLVANPNGCEVVGDIPTVIPISKKSQVMVQTRDAGPGELSFSAESSGGENSTCIKSELRVKSTDPTSHQVHIKGVHCGKCNFFLKWADYTIPGMPTEINVVDPQKCTFACPLLSHGPLKQGENVVVDIDTTQGGNCKPNILVNGPKAACPVTVSDGSDGKYLASFSPWEEGDHIMDVTVGGASIAECPAKFEVIKPIDPSKITVSGAGLKGAIANRRADITIFARESKLIERGFLTFDFKTTSSSSLQNVDYPEIECRDNGNGTYNVSFTPKMTGTLQLNIQTEGKQVLGSPFNISIRPEPNASNCSLSGRVIDDDFFAIVQKPVELTVDSTSAGTGSLSVSGVQPDHSPLRIFATEEHTTQRTLHFLKFDPVMIGTHLVLVKWEGEDIPGVPLSISVVDPYKCNIEESLPPYLKIGASQKVVISTKGAGEAEIVPCINGTGLVAECEERDPDSTTVKLTAVQFGEAEVDLKFGGFSIPKVPFIISVCDPSKCSVDVQEIESKSLVVGVPFHFSVSTRGAGKAKLQVKSHDPEYQYTIDVKCVEEDYYDVTCTAWNVGKQELDVIFGQGSIPGSPITFTVTDPKKCIISGLPDPNHFIPIIGEMISFSVDFSKAGPGTISSKATTADDECSEELEVTVNDSAAQLHYLPNKPGKLQLSLEFNGMSILSGPWVSEVPDPSRFRVTPPKGYGKRREYVKFPITGLTEGTKDIVLKASHPDHDATVKTEPGKDDGMIIAHFTAKHVGEYTINVTHAGQHIDGSPFKVSVTDPDACQVNNPAPTILHIGAKGSISIDCSEAGPGELFCQCEVLSGEMNIESEIRMDDAGKYSIEFTSATIGNGRLRVQWGGYDIPSATYEVSFVDSSRITWSSEPNLLTKFATQGENVCIDIDGREGGQAFPEVKSIGLQSSFAVAVTSNNDGTFTANINTWQIGQNTIEILWGNQPIPNTPISFNVAKAIDARSITATGDGLKHAVTGILAKVLISAPEAGLLERGLLGLKCTSTETGEGEEDDETYLPSIDISDDGDGQYSVSLLASHVGTYYLNIVCNDQPILGSPFPITVHAAADASKCRAFGSALEKRSRGLIISDPVEFSVDTTNAGHGQLSVTVKRPDGGPCRVYSLEESGKKKLHHLKFDPDLVGHYSVDILWDNTHIPNSPFDFDIADPSKCTVNGMPESGSILNLNHCINLSVITTEAGNGSPYVAITQPGAGGDTVLSSDANSLSVYEYNFTTTVLGTHSVSIKFGGRDVPGSPFHFQVIDPTKFSITDLNLKGKYALVCELVSFRVQGKAPQDENLVLLAHGPSADLTIEHQKQSDGSYTCSFVPIEPGDYEVFVECAGKHVNGSPFTVRAADPSKCQILGNIPDMIQVGEPQEIVLKTRGAGAGEIEVYLDGEKESKSFDYKIENQGLDTYCVTLTGKKVCQTKLGIHWAGFSIPKAPFSLTVCDASLCKAFGNVLMSKKGKAGEQITFTVVTHRAGQGNLIVKAKGPSALYNVDVKTVKDSTYEVSFTPWEIGEHSVDVFWGPMHIPKSPFMISVANPMDRVVCNATGPGLKHAISTKPTTFTIMSNEVGLLDKNALKVSVIGVQSHAEVTIKDQNNGCYQVTYVAPTSGAYIASISFYDRQIPGSPFKINVVPGPDASRCRAYGPALHPNALHISGTPLEICVDCSEGGYGSLRVYVQGPNDYRPRIFMADDGKGVYSIKFDAMKAGKYFVVIAWAENHIPGSPFKLKVHPAADASMVKVHGPGLSDGKLGDEGEFTINTKLAGIGTLLVRVHGIRDSFKVEAHPVSSDKPRLLLAHYYPTMPGEYTIFVRWSGVHVPGSPFTVLIKNADGSLPDLTTFPTPVEESVEQPNRQEPLITNIDDYEEDEVRHKPATVPVTTVDTTDDSEAKKSTASSKKSSKKQPDIKNEKTKEKKKKKSKKQTPPPSIGPIPTSLKMKSSPMGGFAMPPSAYPGKLPPGTIIAPDGQLVVRSPSGHFIPVQMIPPQTKRVTKERKDEKTHRHQTRIHAVAVRPTSPTQSPPVSPTHKGAEPTSDPRQQQRKQKKQRKS